MKTLKEQAEQLYVELFGYIAVPQADYISQIINIMGLIRHKEQLDAPEVKRGRKPSNQTVE